MGEARRRQDLGLPPKTVRCPVVACRSRDVFAHPADSPLSLGLAKHWGGVTPTVHQSCGRCRAVWEALPVGWSDDSVERARRLGPCDNCAYRASSPETRDPVQRAELHGHAGACAEIAAMGGLSAPVFACHKGIPIRMSGEDGLSYDFAAAGLQPFQRTCGGFLRMLWAKNGAAKRRRDA